MGKKIFEESHESKKLLATVGGMKIYSDSIYVISGKRHFQDSFPWEQDSILLWMG